MKTKRETGGFQRKPLYIISTLTMGLCCAQTNIHAAELEEIIVTAQKREQSLQEVPVAVSAITGDEIQESVIKDVFDLQNSVPGLTAEQSQTATTSNFSIRGIGTSSQNFGLDSSVGIYVDGVYRSRQSAIINNMLDMQSVEVLRGPQGTLFGKNTPSGAIQFKTRSPDHDNDGFIEYTAGNYNLQNFSGAASWSAIDNELAFRVSTFSGQRDGFVDVDGFGDEVMNDRDRWGVRLQALYTPNDDLSVRVIADKSEIDEICCAGMTLINNDGLIDQRSPQTIAANFPSTDTVLLNSSLGGTVYRGEDYYNYRTALSSLPVSTNEDEGLSVEVNWDLSDQYTLTSISAYRSFNSFDDVDADFIDLELFRKTNDAQQQSFSQEFRLAFNSERVNYVAGAYYFTQDLDVDSDLRIGKDMSPFMESANYDIVAATSGVNQLTNTLRQLSGGAIDFPSVASPFPSSYSAFHRADQDHESWALFGQADINLTDEFILTLGLRYTDEKKTMAAVYDENAPALGPAPDVAAIQKLLLDAQGGLIPSASTLQETLTPLFLEGWGIHLQDVLAPRPNINNTFSDDQLTGTIKLSWLATEDAMVYLSYGTGYKSGGINADRINPSLDPVFAAETSESVEIGLKADFPEQAVRLNLALHYTLVDDFQANTFTGLGFSLQNAGELESYGGELELSWAATDSLDIDLVYAHTIASYKDFKRGNCRKGSTFRGVKDPGFSGDGLSGTFCDRSGDRVPYNSEDFLTLSARQNFTLTDSISAYIAGDYTYNSDSMMDGDNDPLKLRDDFSLLNLRLGLYMDEYGVDVALWGRNVLDEGYHRVAFDVPLQDGKIAAYPGEPATYGLTLKKLF